MNKKILWATLSPLAIISPIATIVSCSSSNSQDVLNAKANIEKNFKIFQNVIRAVKPTEFSSQIPTLAPKNNYGFKSEITKLAADNELGNIKFRLILKRGSTEQTIDFKQFGFLTRAQDQANKIVEPEKYFKSEQTSDLQINVKTKKKDAKIADYLSGDSTKILKDLVDTSQTGQESSIFKTTPKKDDGYTNLTLHDIRPLEFFGQTIGIQAKIQLTRNNNDSIDYNLNITGFDEAAGRLDQPEVIKKRLETFSEMFTTISSPMKMNGKDYLDVLASSVKETNNLTPYLELNKNPEVEITLNKVNSTNDADGSVNAEFTFKWAKQNKDAVQVEPITKNITLYGFKIKE